MINTEVMLQELRQGALAIVKEEAGKYVKQARSDVDDFLKKSQKYLVQWAQEVVTGEMSKDEFEFLMKGRIKDLAAMHALTQAGIAAATIDALRGKMIDLVITIVSKRI